MEKKGTRFQSQTSSNTIGFPRGWAYFVDQLRDINFTTRAAGKVIWRDGSEYVFYSAWGGSGAQHWDGSPDTVVTPDAVGQMYVDDLVNADWWHDVRIAYNVAGKRRQQIYVAPNA